MSLDEKCGLLQGSGWVPTRWWFDLPKYYYVGNTPATPELGIPSLNMQDASGGFRTYWSELSGTVTVWPSILSMAATWDPIAVQDFAVALGKEFRGKGANVILGPGCQVQRVARCGRSFEYLAGDDPYLGSQLTKAYVRGVQSQGVMGIVKHWVFNSQETRRGEENSVVDNKTARELYFPPFEAAIEAGVGGAMCSYNKIDGVYSCSNNEFLNEVLKGELNFQGFVQSDWWAVHEPSFLEGLDQEMPGEALELFLSPVNTSQYPERVDEAATRILAAMYHVNLFETSSCAPPNCSDWFVRNITSASHVALASSLASEAIVLLKNENELLPISHWESMGIPGSVFQEFCRIMSIQHAFSSQSVGNMEADLAIVVVGATSGESVDRPDLNLENEGDELIAAVAKVAGQICGAVLTPWREDVGSILAMFLGGEATGTAWASVLFGDSSPSLATSYRNSSLNAAYAFGFGLAYTQFRYGAPEVVEILGRNLHRLLVDDSISSV
eukprot:Skav224306  [mRNA]  locus=scaffold3003:81753:88056:- [translate_table: standard]